MKWDDLTNNQKKDFLKYWDNRDMGGYKLQRIVLAYLDQKEYDPDYIRKPCYIMWENTRNFDVGISVDSLLEVWGQIVRKKKLKRILKCI